MDLEYLQQLLNISYSLSEIQKSIQVYTLNSQELSKLGNIVVSLEKMTTSIAEYQSTITNQPWFQFVIGAAVTLFATWIVYYLKNKKERRDYLYYLERMIVDQINMIVEIKNIINLFIKRLDRLLADIESNPKNVYSVNSAFFPLFSVRAFPDNVHSMTSGSGYIDNKIGKIFSLSKDFPHIIDDIRLQLQYTLDINQKIAFAKLNSAEVQKEQFKDNIKEYKRVLTEELLTQNIPVFLNLLIQALVAVREKMKRRPISWKMKFDPRYKFFTRKEDFVEARKSILEKLDAHFQPKVQEQLETLNSLSHEKK